MAVHGDPIGVGFGLLIFATWAFAMIAWINHNFRAVPRAVERWADQEGYRIVRKQRRSFFKGPFFLESSNTQVVYRVQVEDAKCQVRDGWVCVGSYFWPSTGRIQVKWDRPRPQTTPDREQPPRGHPMMWDRELDG